MPGTGFDLDNPNQAAQQDGPVECLGITFANDAARREYYLKILAEKLKDPEFRKIEGFPIGEDEDILNLSDPPYYTACPNPFIEDFVSCYGRPYDPNEKYKREPYATDVSEGKNDPIYKAHSYHTKVPHKAIMRYILHYTNPGDIVFDGFCGTGMTGVAAQMCGNRAEVESLGYRVLPDGIVLQEEKDQFRSRSEWVPFSKLGVRRVVLNDLSPAATFIAYNYNTPVDVIAFEKEAKQVIKEVDSECGWMYETLHTDGKTKGKINYTVWSDVFVCPECSNEVIFWENAIDKVAGSVKDIFPCPRCNTELTKRKLEPVWLNKYDSALNESIKQTKQLPVLISYTIAGAKGHFKKVPDEFDLALIEKIEISEIANWFPTDRMMEGKETRRNDPTGITHTHHFYTKRNLCALAAVNNKINDPRTRFLLTGIINRSTQMNRIHLKKYFFGGGGWNAGYLKGTLYISSIPIETSIFEQWSDRLRAVKQAFSAMFTPTAQLVSTQSSSSLALKDNSFDYLFFDPPFGSNLNYSELSFLWESWLKAWTNNKSEAIENSSQGKGPTEYRHLMTICFKEAYRVLKPGRWMTVEFSNTKASVWNSIQAALMEAGFIVANVSALDKKQGSFKVVTTPTAVKQDLVISAYKPNGGFGDRFVIESDEEGVWDFVRTHLGYLPTVKKQGLELDKISERDPRILFDQVVSYFVRNLRDVPLSSKEFQEGLLERFAERDGMIFLPEQVAQYDKVRMTSSQLRQLAIFVDDEASAIEWLRQLLNVKPQTYQDILPKFIDELSGWKKAELQLELSVLLEQNFLKFDGQGQIPPQIHSYLSTNFKEFRNLSKDDSALLHKAKDRWYVPNPEREEDLQKLRERSLLKLFEEYKNHTGKKLKTVRIEAVRCGFKKAWQDRDYATIIQVAEKIPETLLQEDQKLLMWYDQAQTRYSDSSLF